MELPEILAHKKSKRLNGGGDIKFSCIIFRLMLPDIFYFCDKFPNSKGRT